MKTPQQHMSALQALLGAGSDGKIKLSFDATNAEESREARTAIAELQEELRSVKFDVTTDMRDAHRNHVAHNERVGKGLLGAFRKRSEATLERELETYGSVFEQADEMLMRLEGIRSELLYDFFEKQDALELQALQRDRHMRDLKQWKASGVVGHVMVLAADNACDECKELAKQIWNIDEAIRKQPLPHKGCTNETYGFCRCGYISVLTDGTIVG